MTHIIRCALLVFVMALSSAAFAEVTQEQAVGFGRDIYWKGIGSDGTPIKAVVMGDIPVEGTMFSCLNCHRSSGLGSWEGGVITPPTNWSWLARNRLSTNSWRVDEKTARKKYKVADVKKIEVTRPPYTETTFSDLLQGGIDSAGRRINQAMPTYDLSDKDISYLIAYLKTLSDSFPAGVTDKEVHWATIVSDEVEPAKKKALVEILQYHLDSHNNQMRSEGKRSTKGDWSAMEMNIGWRKCRLHVWELKGDPSTWREQLDKFQARQPVFAVLGGISTKPWDEIHDFCEQKRIPCLFPTTDLPKITEGDWYTLYVSKGAYQEGESAARFLRDETSLPEGFEVIQFTDGSPRSALAARGFAEYWTKFGKAAPKNFSFGPDNPPDEARVSEILKANPGAVAAWWLAPGTLPVLDGAAKGAENPMVFVPAGFLAGSKGKPGHELKKKLRVVEMKDASASGKQKLDTLRFWLSFRKFKEVDLRVQGEAYYLCVLFSPIFWQMRANYYPEYFLDNLDMMNDQDYRVPYYMRLSFGPGQRYALKKAQILKFGEGKNSGLVPAAANYLY